MSEKQNYAYSTSGKHGQKLPVETIGC